MKLRARYLALLIIVPLIIAQFIVVRGGQFAIESLTESQRDPNTTDLAPAGSTSFLHLGTGDPPFESDRRVALRGEYFHDQRALPGEPIRPGAFQNAREEALQRVQTGAIPRAGLGPRAVDVNESAWVQMGPQPIGTGVFGFANGVLPNAGRVTAAVATSASVVYIGSADGGVWKTTNADALLATSVIWTPVTDNTPGLTSLAIGSLAVDPNNSSILYAGTGEANNNGDAYTGVGVLKTTNAGANWTLLNPGGIFTGAAIARIAIDPKNSNILYAATTFGAYKSIDAGANWTGPMCFFTFCTMSDVVIDNSTSPNSTVFLARGAAGGSSTNGVYKTTTDQTNVQANWTLLPGTGSNLFPAPPTVGRINLSVTHGAATPTLYAIGSDPTNHHVRGVWKTTDRGMNWMQTTHPETGANGSSICAQCFYDLDIAVFPTDPNVVYALAVELFKSSDGGTTWTNVSHGYTPESSGYEIHVDQHAFAFVPSNVNSIFSGNDGGIYRSTDAGTTWASLNTGLSITQFYRGSTEALSLISVMAGTQDNGSLAWSGIGTWNRSFGGDGGYNAIDYHNPLNVYITTQNLNILRSTGGVAGAFFNINNGIPQCAATCAELRQFISPLVMDPNSPQTLYAGTTKLYKTTTATAGTPTWSMVANIVPGAANRSQAISAIAVSKNAPNTIYVGTGNTSKIFVTTDGSTFTDSSTGLPLRFVTSIAVDSTNDQIAYAAFSGFNTGHIFKTTNRGASWTNVSDLLPNAPVNAVVIDPFNPNVIYLGTDVGVYKSITAGGNWLDITGTLPRAVVTDLVLSPTGTRLFAFTHGRGVYYADRTSFLVTPTPTAGAGGSFTGAVTLQGRTSSGGVQLLVELFFPANAPTPLFTTTVVTNPDGTFTVSGLPTGGFLRIKHARSLAMENSSIITLSAPGALSTVAPVALPTLPTGDADNNNRIDIEDFSLLRARFGTTTTCGVTLPPVFPCADFDGSGLVDIVDFALLRSNFGRQGAFMVLP